MKFVNNEKQQVGGVLEFQSYINDLKSCYRLYKKLFFDRQYLISLVGEKTIKMEMPLGSLPHLLGLNTKSIFQDAIIPCGSAFQQMNELLIKPTYYYQAYEKQGRSIFEVISSHYKEKVESFLLLREINPYTIAFFGNHDLRKSESYYSMYSNCDYDYLMGFENQDHYFCLGLKQTMIENYYVPATNLLIPKESLKKVTFGQMFHPIFYTAYTKGGEKSSVCMNFSSRCRSIQALERLAHDSGATLEVTNYLLEQMQYVAENNGMKATTIQELECQNRDLVTISESSGAIIEAQAQKIYELEEQIKELTDLKEKIESIAQDPDINHLKNEIFDENQNEIDSKLLKKSLNALLPTEYELLCTTYKMYGRTFTSKKELLERFSLSGQKYKTALYHLIHFIHEVYYGLVEQNLFYELLVEPEKLEGAIYQLPEEQQMIFLLRYGLIDQHRYNTHSIAKELNLSNEKVKRLEASGLNDLSSQAK